VRIWAYTVTTVLEKSLLSTYGTMVPPRPALVVILLLPPQVKSRVGRVEFSILPFPQQKGRKSQSYSGGPNMIKVALRLVARPDLLSFKTLGWDSPKLIWNIRKMATSNFSAKYLFTVSALFSPNIRL
jgi:hypothetical protein